MLIRTGFASYFPDPRLFAPDDEGAGGGGGGGDDAGGGGDDVQARIDAAVAGLKKTNAALKSEKQQLAAKLAEVSGMLDGLGGAEGLAELSRLRENLAKNEETKLLAEGKHEEWFDRRVIALRRDHEAQLAALQKGIEDRDQRISIADGRLRAHVLQSDMAAACDAVGVKDSGPKRDALLLAEREWTFDSERGRFVQKDQEGAVVFGKDGRSPKTMEEWLKEKEGIPEFRHWWPSSTSGRSNGSGFAGMTPDDRLAQLSTMTMDEYRKQRKADGAPV